MQNLLRDTVCLKIARYGLDDKKAAINASVTPILLDREGIYGSEDGIVISSLSEL